MKKIFKNKLIITLLTILCLTCLALSGIWIVDYLNGKKNEQLQKEPEQGIFIGDVDEEKFRQVQNGTYEVPEIIPGKYYLNGDINNYYFWIRDDNTIELCCDDMYALFEKWNPGNEQAITEDVTKWSEPRPYSVDVSPFGTVMLSVEYTYDESGIYSYMRGGPCYIDEKTIGKWGIEGDFIRVD